MRAAPASVFHVPAGEAWAAVLRLVETDIASFTGGDCSLLLGFIEDWARGVSWQSPYTAGAASVATIAHWLLPHFSGYRSDEQQKRVLQVIAKSPNGDAKRFAAILQGDPRAKRLSGSRRRPSVNWF